MQVVLTRNDRLALLLAVIVGVYAYPLLKNQWAFLHQWDDAENFYENTAIQSWTWSNLWEMWTMERLNVYEPLGWMLKALQISILNDGVDHMELPRLIRFVTLVLHGTACAVLAKVSKRLLCLLMASNDQKPLKWQYGCYLSAMAYAIHPLHVEIIGWPSAQPYALAAWLSYLSVNAYLNAMEQRHQDASLLSRDMVLSAWLYLCAVLSKSVCLLLPLGFVLLELTLEWQKMHSQWNVSRCCRRLLLICHHRVRLHLILLMMFIIVTLRMNQQGTHVDADVFSLTLGERMIKAFMMPYWMMRHLLWPIRLRAHYQLHENELDLMTNMECVWSIVCLICAIVLIAMHSFQSNRMHHLMVCVYFLVMQLPTSGLIQHGMVMMCSNRYAYFPAAILVPYGGYWLTNWLRLDTLDEEKAPTAPMGTTMAREEVRQPEDLDQKPGQAPEDTTSTAKQAKQAKQAAITPSVRNRSTWLLFATIAIALAVISSHDLQHWRNEDSLYIHSIVTDPTDWRMLDGRANALLRNGGCGSGPEHRGCHHLWELSYFFTPKATLKAQLQRTKLVYFMGMHERACHEYLALLKSYAYSCAVQNNAALCFVQQHDFTTARQHFIQATLTKGYESYHHIPLENLKTFDHWLQHHVKKDGIKHEIWQPFEGRLMW